MEEASVRNGWPMHHSNIAYECQHSSTSPLTLKTCSQSCGVNECGAMKSWPASQAAVSINTQPDTQKNHKAVTTMKPGSNPPCVQLLAAALRAQLHVCSRLYCADSPATSASRAPWSRSRTCMTVAAVLVQRWYAEVCVRRQHSLRILSPLSPVVPRARCKPPLRRPTLSWQRGQTDGWAGERWCQWRHSAHATVGRESRLQSLHCSWSGEGERTQREGNGSVKLELQFLILRSYTCRAVNPHPPREDRWPPDQRGSQRTAIRRINSH